MYKGKKIIVVVPDYNEERFIGKVLEDTVDLSGFGVDSIENCPESLHRVKATPG